MTKTRRSRRIFLKKRTDISQDNVVNGKRRRMQVSKEYIPMPNIYPPKKPKLESTSSDIDEQEKSIIESPKSTSKPSPSTPSKAPILSLSVLSSPKPKPPLFRIASPAYRLEVLENAASSISDIESSLFPTHGTRPWTCEVKLTPTSKLLFHVSNEKIELACLPQLLEQISSNERVVSERAMPIERTWYSPNLEIFRSRKSVLQHVEELKRRDKIIDKYLLQQKNTTRCRGNKKTPPPPPSNRTILKAIHYRFLRDGIYVGTPNTPYRLTPHQIDLCHTASIYHFETVMYTVKARALYNELRQGFDVLRERGRGRYDMEIPSFDDPERFGFLTAATAAWMPLVEMILGRGAVLIHKGCFLSLPGSDAQVYHQDGVHMCEERQKKCYAINVFIPLCDLTPAMGPTQFCLGSHYLGHDYYVKEKCVSPMVTAGTPVIFDYRLGHRGLANTSDDPRPVLYLTYAGSGFKDAANFSRRRYRKLGKIVDLPVSRGERARRRAIAEEERETNSVVDDEEP